MGEKKRQEAGGGAPAWMVTFADVSMLLLTFFVLLLSFASMDIAKFRDAMGSIQEALGAVPVWSSLFHHRVSPALIDEPIAISDSGETKAAIKKEVDEFIADYKLKDRVQAYNTKRGVILRVQGRAVFYPETADIKAEAKPIFKKISYLLKKYPERISLEGHTDNIPISSDRYASNWHLSTARAFSALIFLKENEGINIDRMNIAGYADTHPLTSNDTPEGRAQNSRIEFIFSDPSPSMNKESSLSERN